MMNFSIHLSTVIIFIFFFFNDTATTEIYTLSLHDALPICRQRDAKSAGRGGQIVAHRGVAVVQRDRKSTRLNSSHSQISYAVFCLKKKNTTNLRQATEAIRNSLNTCVTDAHSFTTTHAQHP